MVLLARPGGSFHRAIRLITRDPTTVEAELEDDFHRFGVILRHDGVAVRAVEGRSTRYPWTSCPLASGALNALQGLPIGSHPADIYRFADPRLQCTHQFELAGLAASHAARPPGERRYDLSVEDFDDEGRRATLGRDGLEILAWRFSGGVLVEPPPMVGTSVASLNSRSMAGLPHEQAEARLLLRRAIWLSRGRWIDIDVMDTAAGLDPPGACFSYQPGVAKHGRRRRGSERDFSIGARHPLTAVRRAE